MIDLNKILVADCRILHNVKFSWKPDIFNYFQYLTEKFIYLFFLFYIRFFVLKPIVCLCDYAFLRHDTINSFFCVTCLHLKSSRFFARR